MKILALSDLHIETKKDMIRLKNSLIEKVDLNTIDLIIITGDIFEPAYGGNPYKQLADYFDNKKVICTLGNHEFIGRTIDKTIDFYRRSYQPDKYDVHYLDVIDYIDIGNLRFIGNVLFYDGSTKTISTQDVGDFSGAGWTDKHIVNFDYKLECAKNIEKIKENVEIDKINILCTHCIPHWKLNGHVVDDSNYENALNAYGGVADLLERINVNYSFSGHTHWRMIGKFINNCYCVNVGGNMFRPINYHVMDI